MLARASTLYCYHTTTVLLVPMQTFWRALTASVDRCADFFFFLDGFITPGWLSLNQTCVSCVCVCVCVVLCVCLE